MITDFVPIHFKQGENQYVPCLSITPELADDIRRAGLDPNRFNRMRWPLGAADHGSCWVLMHTAQLKALMPNEIAITEPVKLEFGGILFDKMYLRTPRPVIVGVTADPQSGQNGPGVLYAVEVVDERWLWQVDASALAGFNLSTDDKELLYDSTEVSAGVPWSCLTAITALLAEISTTAAEWDIDDVPTDTGCLRDLFAKGKNVGRLIDQMLCIASPGFVLAAYPNATYNSAASGMRYKAVRVQSGADALQAIIDTAAYKNAFLCGGWTALQSASPPSGQIGLNASGLPSDLRIEVPAQVRVNFPKAAKAGAAYVLNQEADADPAVHYATKRFYPVISANGIPTGSDGFDGQTVDVFDSTWALMDGAGTTPTNDAALTARADDVASMFYARYKAGCGEAWFAGVQPIVPWSGAQVIEWSVNSRGAFTRTWGEIDSPLYGWKIIAGRGLDVDSVWSSGAVRAIPNPYGGLLIDAPNGFTGMKWIRIDDGATAFASNRYKYPFTEMEMLTDTFTVKADGITGTTSSGWAINSMENAHQLKNGIAADAAGMIAPGIDQDGPAYPSGFSMQPIKGLPVVPAWPVVQEDGTIRYVFAMANAHDGECL